MEEQLETWDNYTLLPLPLRVSPMRGWVDAVPHITTPYSLLLHNDGYALDPFFACELVEALKARKQVRSGPGPGPGPRSGSGSGSGLPPPVRN